MTGSLAEERLDQIERLLRETGATTGLAGELLLEVRRLRMALQHDPRKPTDVPSYDVVIRHHDGTVPSCWHYWTGYAEYQYAWAALGSVGALVRTSVAGVVFARLSDVGVELVKDGRPYATVMVERATPVTIGG